MVLGPAARRSHGGLVRSGHPASETMSTGAVLSVLSFSQPVNVFVGLGFPYEISSLMEACQVLDEWSGSRTSTYEATSAACRAALAGKTDVESARLAFEAFARAGGILASDAPGPLAIPG